MSEAKCERFKHVCHLREDGWCEVRQEHATGRVQVSIPDYECVDFALPARELEIRNAWGKVIKKGVDPKTGIDHNPITARYKHVDNSLGPGLGRPVQRNRQDIRETFANDAVKKRGLVYER